MAKVVLSSLLDSLTGKLSGSVFQVSTGGLQLRVLVKPRNPRTGKQQAVRGSFLATTSKYRNLTTTQRSSWSDASTLPVEGYARYNASNFFRANIGLLPMSTYSGTGLLTAPGTEIKTLSTTSIILKFAPYNGEIPVNNYILIYATEPLGPGIGTISPSQMIFLTSQPPGSYINDEWDITTAYSQKFGLPAADSVLGFRAVVIDTVTGDWSEGDITQGVTV